MKDNRVLRFFQIFRSGIHTAMSGATRFYSDKDLEDMANLYNCGVFRAPLYLGHPNALDNPRSFGEVMKLVADKGKLFANALVSPEMIDLVRTGHYKKVSVSLSPHKSFRGAWLVCHVGFLGAQPPAVKGMTDPVFGEMRSLGAVCFADEGVVFGESKPASSPGEALANRIECYREMAPSLTYWQAYALATTS